MPLSREQMRDVVDRYFAAWNSLDSSAYRACFSEDAVVHDPYGATPLRGGAALLEFFLGIAKALQEVTVAVNDMYVAGNRIAVVFKGNGVGKNGKPVSIEGVDVFEMNDGGKITGLWSYWDPAAVLAKVRS